MKKLLGIRFYYVVILVLVIGFIFSCSKNAIEHEEELTYELTANITDNSLIEGQYIVILSTLPGKKSPQAVAALESISKEVGQIPGAKINRKFSHVLTGFAAKLTDKQVEKLKKDPRVESVEQDSHIYPSGELVVQEYPDWGLDRIDQREKLLDRGYAYTASGKGVTAYMVDTGIRFTHNEFEERATLGHDFVWEEEPENRDSLLGEGEDCWVEGGHGTSVASALGGAQYGVAKDVQLKSVRVWGCDGSSPRSRIIAAVDWITAHVIENGTLPAVVNMGGAHADSEVAVAIENSIKEGIFYVGVAGNKNMDGCDTYPADLSGRMSVGASDINDKRASFSNYGDCVDLYAPGELITSASNTDDVSSNKYSGTSISSPYVAGVAALYLELYPDATPAQVKTAIINNSTTNAISDVPSGPNNLVYSLWESIEFTPPLAPDLLLQATGEKVRSDYVANLTWSPTDAEHIWIYEDGIVQDTPYLNDGEAQIKLRKKGRDATYKLKICEVGYDNCSDDVILEFGKGSGTEEPVNTPPSAGFNFSSNLLDVEFIDTSTDPDGSIVLWNWDFGDGNSSSAQNPEHVYAASGTYNVSLTVTDDAGATGNTSKNVSVNAEEPQPGDIVLNANGYKVKGAWQADLDWTPSGTSERIEIHRDGNVIATISNVGSYTDVTSFKGSGSFTYKICEVGTTTCSNEVTVQF